MVLIGVSNKSYWIFQLDHVQDCRYVGECWWVVGWFKRPSRKGLGTTNLNNGMSLVCNYSNESPGVMSVLQFLEMGKSFPNTAIFQDKQVVPLQTHVIWLSHYCCVKLVAEMLELLC